MVKVENLNKRYSNLKVLKDISIDFNSGEVVGIIGPNSSGKSTFLKTLAGLVKPDSGKIEMFGDKISRKTKEKIAFLPEINHLYDWMKVNEILNFFDSQFKNFNIKKAEELLKYMEVPKEISLRKLSKGMLGRVKLLLVLAREVPLIILDEPLNGLDLSSRHKILDTILDEYEFEKQTILISTHELFEIEHIFDRVVFLKEGRVKLKGSMDDLRSEYKMNLPDIVGEVFDEKDFRDD